MNTAIQRRAGTILRLRPLFWVVDVEVGSRLKNQSGRLTSKGSRSSELHGKAAAPINSLPFLPAKRKKPHDDIEPRQEPVVKGTNMNTAWLGGVLAKTYQ